MTKSPQKQPVFTKKDKKVLSVAAVFTLAVVGYLMGEGACRATTGMGLVDNFELKASRNLGAAGNTNLLKAFLLTNPPEYTLRIILNQAAAHGHKDAVNILIDHGGITQFLADESLVAAVENRHLDIAEVLLKKNLASEPQLATALFIAVENNDIPAMDLLVKYNAKADSSHFFRAAHMNDRNMLDFLKAHASSPEACEGAWGGAVGGGHDDLLPYLQQNNFGKPDGLTFWIAAKSGPKAILSLLAHGGEMKIAEDALKRAMVQGSEDRVQALLDAKIDPMSVQPDVLNPLIKTETGRMVHDAQLEIENANLKRKLASPAPGGA
jgi:hypothetical protein